MYYTLSCWCDSELALGTSKSLLLLAAGTRGVLATFGLVSELMSTHEKAVSVASTVY
jgi:hypothetical protein